MKHYLFFLIVLSGIGISGCVKCDLPEGIPYCIEQKIREIKSEDVRNPPASVWRIIFEGEDYYYIPPYCCDMFSELYDSDCNLICHPDGGITGTGDGQCPEYVEAMEIWNDGNRELIWRDDRE